jgi:hypothetical protein
MVSDIPMTPCKSCGIVNHYAERHPHPDIVRWELATMIYERHEAEKKDKAAFRSELRRSLMSDYWHDYENRTNGGTVTN